VTGAEIDWLLAAADRTALAAAGTIRLCAFFALLCPPEDWPNWGGRHPAGGPFGWKAQKGDRFAGRMSPALAPDGPRKRGHST